MLLEISRMGIESERKEEILSLPIKSGSRKNIEVFCAPGTEHRIDVSRIRDKTPLRNVKIRLTGTYTFSIERVETESTSFEALIDQFAAAKARRVNF